MCSMPTWCLLIVGSPSVDRCEGCPLSTERPFPNRTAILVDGHELVGPFECHTPSA